MPSSRDPLERAVDEIVSAWPEVRAKQVFGHRGYVRAGHMFAFLADPGVAFKAAPALAEKLYASGAAHPFVYGGAGAQMRGWPVVPLANDDDVTNALTRVQTAWEEATPGDTSS